MEYIAFKVIIEQVNQNDFSVWKDCLISFNHIIVAWYPDSFQSSMQYLQIYLYRELKKDR